MPVREVNIPKPDKGLRALGIPTVTDRLIQQAISQKLSPIRRKLRVIVWKHWKKPRTKFRKLLGMGLPNLQARIAWCRKKYWRLSKTPQLNTVMGIAYFKEKGLINLVERYCCLLYTSPSPRDGLLSRMPSSA